MPALLATILSEHGFVTTVPRVARPGHPADRASLTQSRSSVSVPGSMRAIRRSRDGDAAIRGRDAGRLIARRPAAGYYYSQVRDTPCRDKETTMLTAVLTLLTLSMADGPAGLTPRTASGRVPAREIIARIHDAHGHVGPWAVVGYRMGQRALEELKLPRHSKSLLVVHHTPLEFKFTCAADGVMAVTGATPGKMNIRLQECPLAELRTVITDRSTGRVLVFRLRPERAGELAGVTPSQLDAMSRRFAELPDEAIFEIKEEKTAPTMDRSSGGILP
ncbi:MAG: formylmethanofuran dehydrogenase subunit E family protein [Isosphaeraceae bacterium]